MLETLKRLYDAPQAESLYRQLQSLLIHAKQARPFSLSERDVMLICYGDHVRQADEAPLETLRKLLKARVSPTVANVHLLPFYPYSSDDGFSVIDYYAIDPNLGTWDDVERFSHDFKLMFDAVFNHISAQSAWFQAFLRDEAPYNRYFVTVDPNADVSMVVRPRTLPLLTPVETPTGTKHVWTTFSTDQVDLNVANPDVLLEVIKILLFYVEKGAVFIRLDAIAFLWKEIGTPSIHLPQTHLIIQLMREILDHVAPEVVLITETNVPHAENIAYFGDGHNEAQLVYQFPLPPLILHTMHTGNTTALSTWATSLEQGSDATTFFNFTASHDGIGLRPVTGILTPDQIQALVDLTHAHGGFVSYRSTLQGDSPYELNITYFDAVTDPAITAQDPQTAVNRFMVSQAMALALAGMPGIYFNSLFGGRNDREAVDRTGHKRAINREKLPLETLQEALDDTGSIRARVYAAYRRLLDVRTAHPAFHPLGAQIIHTLHEGVFAVERIAPDNGERIFALHNVTGDAIDLAIPVSGVDLFTGNSHNDRLILPPYAVCWLQVRD